MIASRQSSLRLGLRRLGRPHLGGQALVRASSSVFSSPCGLRDLLAELLLLGAQPLEVGDRRAPVLVGRERHVDDVTGQPPLRLGGTDSVRVVAEHSWVDHVAEDIDEAPNQGPGRTNVGSALGATTSPVGFPASSQCEAPGASTRAWIRPVLRAERPGRASDHRERRAEAAVRLGQAGEAGRCRTARPCRLPHHGAGARLAVALRQRLERVGVLDERQAVVLAEAAGEDPARSAREDAFLARRATVGGDHPDGEPVDDPQCVRPRGVERDPVRGQAAVSGGLAHVHRGRPALLREVVERDPPGGSIPRRRPRVQQHRGVVGVDEQHPLVARGLGDLQPRRGHLHRLPGRRRDREVRRLLGLAVLARVAVQAQQPGPVGTLGRRRGPGAGLLLRRVRGLADRTPATSAPAAASAASRAAVLITSG